MVCSPDIVEQQQDMLFLIFGYNQNSEIQRPVASAP
jgi:hypothetical protein